MLRTVTLDELQIDDRDALSKLALYRELEQVLRRDAYPFRVPRGDELGWNRAAFLNLTFWNASEASDVLTGTRIPADVVTHAAWHHLARRALPRASADAAFLGEAIASAFDLYLVGALLRAAPECEFLESQVPLMAEACAQSGLSDDDFEALIERVGRRPERAFEDLRQLLFDAATRLVHARGVDHAAELLAELDAHPFAPLLHHYELSNWVLYARAHLAGALEPDEDVRVLDRALRGADDSLEWLERRWLAP